MNIHEGLKSKVNTVCPSTNILRRHNNCYSSFTLCRPKEFSINFEECRDGPLYILKGHRL